MANKPNPRELMPDASGALTEPAARKWTATFETERKIQLKRVAIGAALTGMMMALRKPNLPSWTDMYPLAMEVGRKNHQGACVPPGNGASGCGCSGVNGISDAQLAAWNEMAQERFVGEQMGENLGEALLHDEVTELEWVQFYRQAIAKVQGGGVVMVKHGGGVGEAGFRSPLAVPSEVTSAFATARGDEEHRGIDLRAAVGTPVQAPTNMRVEKVFFDEGGGLTVKASVQRPDGTYPVLAPAASDDTGFFLTFSHLSHVEAAEGQEIPAGVIFAKSGNTGKNTTGPHLHLASEYLIDNVILDDRYFVDPTALIPESVIRGELAAAPLRPGVMRGLQVDRMNAAESSPIAVTINGDGIVQLEGTAVQTNIKPSLRIDRLGVVPGGTGAGGELAFPPQMQDAIKQAKAAGGEVLSGLGSLAGRAFHVVTSPEGLVQLGEVVEASSGIVGLGFKGVGTAAEVASPFVTGIPYVGGALSIGLGLGGKVLSVLATPAEMVLKGAGGLLKKGGLAAPDLGLKPPPPNIKPTGKTFY